MNDNTRKPHPSPWCYRQHIVDLAFQIVTPLLVLQYFILQTSNQSGLILLSLFVGVQTFPIITRLVL